MRLSSSSRYLLVKDTLVRESNSIGSLRKVSARNLIKMDVNKTSRIYDFLCKSVSCSNSYLLICVS